MFYGKLTRIQEKLLGARLRRKPGRLLISRRENVLGGTRSFWMTNDGSRSTKMLERRRKRGGKQGEQGRATIASVLGIELERERETGRRTRSLGCNSIDTRRQDNVSLIVWNKRLLTAKMMR